MRNIEQSHFSDVTQKANISVAHTFSKDGGMVIQLAPKWKREINSSKCLDVSSFSQFKHEKEKLFAGMTVLSIINIYTPSDDAWKGYSDYIQSMLYFERVIEQSAHQRDQYNYGIMTHKSNLQSDCLIPLMKQQMNRTAALSDLSDEIKTDSNGEYDKIPSYICNLFEHFCDNQRDYIDLSCIYGEVENMVVELKQILFEEIKIDGENDTLTKYQINVSSIQSIFPNLIPYKNPIGYCIKVHSISEAMK